MIKSVRNIFKSRVAIPLALTFILSGCAGANNIFFEDAKAPTIVTRIDGDRSQTNIILDGTTPAQLRAAGCEQTGTTEHNDRAWQCPRTVYDQVQHNIRLRY